MNEFYMEQLVPRKTGDVKRVLVKNIVLGITIATLVAMFIIPILVFLFAILVIVDIILYRTGDIEYEYLYLNGELDIDKIIAKQKRKHAFTLNMNDVIVIAPMESAEVRPFQNLKVIDYSSGKGGPSVYKAVFSKDNQNMSILIEPNEMLLNGMKMVAPRKVFV